MAKALSNFDQMWESYPSPGGEAEEVKATIGGAVNADWVTNTCVIRVSRAMNYAGHPIPLGYPNLVTLRGADGKRYAIRVAEFQKYMQQMYGPPQIKHEYDPPGGEPPPEIMGKQGIICFNVTGWNDATGHFDLWNGSECRHHGYFERASSVLLWEVPSGAAAGQLTGNGPRPRLLGSVGQSGKNRTEDVLIVQLLLKARGEDPGPANGHISDRTIDAIRDFQARFLSNPDGRVDPGGRTWRELNAQG